MIYEKCSGIIGTRCAAQVRNCFGVCEIPWRISLKTEEKNTADSNWGYGGKELCLWTKRKIIGEVFLYLLQFTDLNRKEK